MKKETIERGKTILNDLEKLESCNKILKEPDAVFTFGVVPNIFVMYHINHPLPKSFIEKYKQKIEELIEEHIQTLEEELKNL